MFQIIFDVASIKTLNIWKLCLCHTYFYVGQKGVYTGNMTVPKPFVEVTLLKNNNLHIDPDALIVHPQALAIFMYLWHSSERCSTPASTKVWSKSLIYRNMFCCCIGYFTNLVIATRNHIEASQIR